MQPPEQGTYNPSQSRQAGVLHPFPFLVLSCSQTQSGIPLCPFSSLPHLLTHLVQIYRAFSQNSATKMPPIEKPVPGEKYDIVFIGGGSGGSAGSVCFTRLCSHSGTKLRHASCVASRLALWRKDRPHRGIRKAGRYLRKRWWVSLFWWFAYAHMRLAQAACRKR